MPDPGSQTGALDGRIGEVDPRNLALRDEQDVGDAESQRARDPEEAHRAGPFVLECADQERRADRRDQAARRLDQPFVGLLAAHLLEALQMHDRPQSRRHVENSLSQWGDAHGPKTSKLRASDSVDA